MNYNFLLAFIFIVFLNCSQEKPLSFEIIKLDHQTFTYCSQSICPEFNIEYLITKGNKLSQVINQQIQITVIDLILKGEEKMPDVYSVEQALLYFIDTYKTHKSQFTHELLTYDANTSMQVNHQSDQLLSIQFNYYLFTGGAHGYSGISYLNFDLKTGFPLSNQALFTDYDAALKYCEKLFRKKFSIAEDKNINSTGFWFNDNTFHFPENIGFTDTEMILNYNVYEIASYAEGPITLFIPKSDIIPFLNYL